MTLRLQLCDEYVLCTNICELQQRTFLSRLQNLVHSLARAAGVLYS